MAPIGQLVAGGGDPVLAYDTEGRLHLTWLSVTLNPVTLLLGPEMTFSLLHATSTDDGVNWETDDGPVVTAMAEVSIDFGTDTLTAVTTGRAVDKEWIIVDTFPNSPHYGKLYMVYAELDIIASDSVRYQILLQEWSASGGWSEARVAISTEDLRFCQFVNPAIDPEGNLHLLVAGASESDPFSALYHTQSQDGGVTFGVPNFVSYFDLPCFLQSPDSEPCVMGIGPDRTFPSNYLYSHPVTGELYAIWYADGFKEPVTEGTDIYFSRSSDGGATWMEAAVLNERDDPAVDNFMPTGVLTPKGDLFVTWYDQRIAVGKTHYYGIKYAGGQFGEEFIVSNVPTDFATVGVSNGNFGVGEYNTTLSIGDRLLPIWADGRQNNGQLDLYLAVIEPEGGVVAVRSLNTYDLRLRIDPNPVSDRLIFSFLAGHGDTDFRGSIYDQSGRMVQQLPDLSAVSDDRARYEVPLALPAGIYVLNVYSPRHGLSSRKFIKR